VGNTPGGLTRPFQVTFRRLVGARHFPP
jgi:hypothetical protein